MLIRFIPHAVSQKIHGVTTTGPRCAFLLLLGFLWQLPAASFEANTQPIQAVELRLLAEGAVRDIAVKLGAQVAAGDLLVQLNDDAAQARLALDKAEAENTLAVEMAQLVASQRAATYDRMQVAFTKHAVPQFEVDRARLESEVAQLEEKQARFHAEQAKRQQTLATVAVANTQLRSPFAGFVERIDLSVGEFAGPDRPAVYVVDVSRMKIEAAIPLSLAAQLQTGQTVEVAWADNSRQQATIVWLAHAADAASATRSVRCELDNPQQRPSGERVMVHITP
jgi:RND family efflux transporter MFP subunit